jgi:hypothetical protein
MYQYVFMPEIGTQCLTITRFIKYCAINGTRSRTTGVSEDIGKWQRPQSPTCDVIATVVRDFGKSDHQAL